MTMRVNRKSALVLQNDYSGRDHRQNSADRERCFCSYRIGPEHPYDRASPDFSELSCATSFLQSHWYTAARLIAEYHGCGIVSVSVNGRAVPALSAYTGSGQQFKQRVLAIADSRWPYYPARRAVSEGGTNGPA